MNVTEVTNENFCYIVPAAAAVHPYRTSTSTCTVNQTYTIIYEIKVSAQRRNNCPQKLRGNFEKMRIEIDFPLVRVLFRAGDFRTGDFRAGDFFELGIFELEILGTIRSTKNRRPTQNFENPPARKNPQLVKRTRTSVTAINQNITEKRVFSI